MKRNIRILFISFFLLQPGYFITTAYPEKDFPNQILFFAAYLFVSVSMLTICIELYYTANGIIKNTQQEMELTAMRQQQHLQEEQTTSLLERKDQFQKFQQNMTEQLLVLQKYVDQGNYEQASSYLSDITGKFQEERFRPCCSDSLLNAILESKHQIALRHQIQVTYELLLPETSKIPITDLSCVLFNLLDNGIESCIRSLCTEPYLQLSISVNVDFLAIHMHNSKNPDEHFHYGSSGKSDPENHGFGLSIIADCAERNDGTCEWRDLGNNFESMVLLRYK